MLLHNYAIDLLPDTEAWNIVDLMSHPGCYLPFYRPKNIIVELLTSSGYNQACSIITLKIIAAQIYLEALAAPLSIAEHPTSSSSPSSNFLKSNHVVVIAIFIWYVHM